MLEYAINAIELLQPLWSFNILQAICMCMLEMKIFQQLSRTVRNILDVVPLRLWQR